MARLPLKAGRGRRVVRVAVEVDGISDRGGALEFGLQDAEGGLDPGEPTPDGAVAYLTEVAVRPRPDGTVSYSGPHVHGPTVERFFYISFRAKAGANPGWVRRLKIHLPAKLDESVDELRARVTDLGTTKGRFHGEGWIKK